MTFKKQLLHPDRCGSCFYLLHSLVKACVNFLIFYGSLASRSRLLRVPGQRKSLPLRYAEAGFLIA
jgi:hypothetical protein